MCRTSIRRFEARAILQARVGNRIRISREVAYVGLRFVVLLGNLQYYMQSIDICRLYLSHTYDHLISRNLVLETMHIVRTGIGLLLKVYLEMILSIIVTIYLSIVPSALSKKSSGAVVARRSYMGITTDMIIAMRMSWVRPPPGL